MKKDIQRLCARCGTKFYTTGKNPHRHCSFRCYVDDNTEKQTSRFEVTKCWLWRDEEAELTNHETHESFSVRNHLLNEQGISIKGKFMEMRCERRCCVNPDHIMVCDNPDEFYFDQLTKQLNPDTVHEAFKQIGTDWKPKF
ncbi:MAG: hypothetical protein ABF479_02115 [Gluconacetobacter sp.]